MKISNSDLPGLFQAADESASRAQKRYAQLVALDLGVMITGALLGALSLGGEGAKQELALASAIAIAISFAMTFALKSEHFSGTWYDGRAVAESTKTTAWLYMMRADPYGNAKTDADADREFSDSLDSFVKERKKLAGSLAARTAALPEITDAMRAVRAMTLNDRKSLYGESRITDQRKWYATKSELNSRKSSLFFGLILICQGLALVAAIILVRWPEPKVNFTGVFAALAAALIAWTQLKKHEELASVYGLTAQELGSVATQARHASTEQEFSQFVGKAENAITREHTLWLARREQY
jgi:hypothetical protein